MYRSFIIIYSAILWVLSCQIGAASEERGKVLYEVWLKNRSKGLEKGADWEKIPTIVSLQPEFEAGDRKDIHYTSRLSALVTIPEDGIYRFWISSKDDGRLYAAYDGNPQHVALIADSFRGTSFRAWGSNHHQGSDPVFLTRGANILLIGLQVHVWSPKKHLSVGWSLDDGPVTVIPTAHCSIPWDIWGALAAVTPTSCGVDKQFIEIEWPRINYGLGLTAFNVYRDNALIATDIHSYGYVDATVTEGKTYNYTVQAVDLLGRLSPMGDGATVTARAPTVRGTGTGLTAGYYLPLAEKDKDLGTNPQMQIDATLFLQNRKAHATFKNSVQPSYQWYCDNVVYMADFISRSVRMEGFVEVPHDGEWTFHIMSSDRVMFWLNRRLLINASGNPGPHTNAVTIRLKAGERIPLRLESDNRLIQIEWEHAQRPREIIPTPFLYPQPFLGSETISVVSSPKSYTSPAHLEVMAGTKVKYLACSVNGSDLNLTPLDMYRYLCTGHGDARVGVPLMADQANAVTLSYGLKPSSRTSVQHSITWEPIRLGKTTTIPEKLVIRQGDELLFSDNGSKQRVDKVFVTFNGTASWRPTAQGRLTFSDPGVYQISQSHDAYALTLDVIPVISPTPVMFSLGMSRFWTLPEPIREVYVEAGDDRRFCIEPSLPRYEDALLLQSTGFGNSHLIVRTRPGGPVLNLIPTEALEYSVGKRFSAGTILPGVGEVCRSRVSFSHMPPGLRLQFEVDAISLYWLCRNGKSRDRIRVAVDRNNQCVIPMVARPQYRGRGEYELALHLYQDDVCLENLHRWAEP